MQDLQKHPSNSPSNNAKRIRDQQRYGEHGRCHGNDPRNYTKKKLNELDHLPQKQTARRMKNEAEFKSLRQKLATMGPSETNESPTYICDEATVMFLASSGVPMAILAPIVIMVGFSLIGGANAQSADDAQQTCPVFHNGTVTNQQNGAHLAQRQPNSELFGAVKQAEIQPKIDGNREKNSVQNNTRKKGRRNDRAVESSDVKSRCAEKNNYPRPKVTDLVRECSKHFTAELSPELQGDDATLSGAIVLVGEVHAKCDEINRILARFYRPGDDLLVEEDAALIASTSDTLRYGLTDFGEGGCFGIDHPTAREQLELAWNDASQIAQGTIEFIHSLTPGQKLPKHEMVLSKQLVWVATRPQLNRWMAQIKQFHSDVIANKVLLTREQNAEGAKWLRGSLDALGKYNSLYHSTTKEREQDMYMHIIDHADQIKINRPGHNVDAIIGLEHADRIKKPLLASGRKVLVLSQKK